MYKVTTEQTPKTLSFREVCNTQEVYCLEHKTKIAYLPGILKDGCLVSRSEQTGNANRFMGGDPHYVYLAPYETVPVNTKTEGKLASGGNDVFSRDANGKIRFAASKVKTPYVFEYALLLVDLNILEKRADYHANPALTNHGEKNSNSFNAEQILNSANTPIKNIKEICFSSPIELKDYLLEIWVHPSVLEEVKTKLQESQVEPYWINKIVAFDIHPDMRERMANYAAISNAMHSGARRWCSFHWPHNPLPQPDKQSPQVDISGKLIDFDMSSHHVGFK